MQFITHIQLQFFYIDLNSITFILIQKFNFDNTMQLAFLYHICAIVIKLAMEVWKLHYSYKNLRADVCFRSIDLKLAIAL